VLAARGFTADPVDAVTLSAIAFVLHPIPWLYAAWLACVAAQRTFELVLSERHIRATRRDRSRTADDRAGWIAMIAVHTALIVLPALEVSWLERRAPAWLAWAAFAVFACAQGLRYAAIRALGSAWNARGVVDRALVVVERGPYRWIRHPNYVAVMLEFTAVPLGGGAWLSWIVLNAAHSLVLARRIRGEEALLAAVPGYSQRMGQKGRFLPRRGARPG
jgi:methyltransferase